MNKANVLRHLKQTVMIALGVLLMDLGYYFFFSPQKLVCGGVTGLSIVLGPLLEKINMPQSIFLYIIESVCLLLGLLLLGKEFFLKTILASLLAPTFVFILEQIAPQDLILRSVENKFLLTLICGSLLSGSGIGICLKNNGSTGGMDVIQKSLSKYLHIPYSIAMYSTDCIIILFSGLVINGNNVSYNLEYVVFGMIAVFVIAYIIDSITLNAKTRRTAYIVTNKPEEIKNLIFTTIGRGCTEADVRGSYTNTKKVMLICVLDKNESYKLGELIKTVDDEAFTFFTKTKEVVGDYARNPKKDEESKKGIEE